MRFPKNTTALLSILFTFLFSSIQLESSPKLISLSPAITEIIYALGAEDQLLAVTSYCDYPPAARQKPRIGGYMPQSLSLEAINALEPDLILGEAGTHDQLAPAFSRLGIAYNFLPFFDIGDILAAITAIGDISESWTAARDLVQAFRLRLDALGDSLPPADERKRVFWEVWDNPLMSCGPDTYLGQAIDYAGGLNIFADATTSWPLVSFETLLARDPYIIIYIEQESAAGQSSSPAQRRGWAMLNAVKAGRLIQFDSDLLSRPGPRVINGIEELASQLYPEHFN